MAANQAACPDSQPIPGNPTPVLGGGGGLAGNVGSPATGFGCGTLALQKSAYLNSDLVEAVGARYVSTRMGYFWYQAPTESMSAMRSNSSSAG